MFIQKLVKVISGALNFGIVFGVDCRRHLLLLRHTKKYDSADDDDVDDATTQNSCCRNMS